MRPTMRNSQCWKWHLTGWGRRTVAERASAHIGHLGRKQSLQPKANLGVCVCPVCSWPASELVIVHGLLRTCVDSLIASNIPIPQRSFNELFRFHTLLFKSFGVERTGSFGVDFSTFTSTTRECEITDLELQYCSGNETLQGVLLYSMKMKQIKWLTVIRVSLP